MSKENKALAPVTLHPGSSAAFALTIVGCVMCAIILLVSLFTPAVHPLYCVVVLVGFLPLILLSLLIDALSPAKSHFRPRACICMYAGPRLRSICPGQFSITCTDWRATSAASIFSQLKPWTRKHSLPATRIALKTRIYLSPLMVA